MRIIMNTNERAVLKRRVAMTGFWDVGAALWAALTSLDFFASVFYQEKIEGPAGEAND